MTNQLQWRWEPAARRGSGPRTAAVEVKPRTTVAASLRRRGSIAARLRRARRGPVAPAVAARVRWRRRRDMAAAVVTAGRGAGDDSDVAVTSAAVTATLGECCGATTQWHVVESSDPRRDNNSGQNVVSSTKFDNARDSNDVRMPCGSNMQMLIGLGDRNTSFFYAKINKRARRQRVTRLKISNGQWREDNNVLRDEATAFFKVFFQKWRTFTFYFTK
ncbi:hypothetical protein Syun_014265 [Stephania yunnanensis]|uniref:Uncharacterized protein n=1 Tax=Stephania yunnanensis TaxID=152371 RepID=A0AAP0PBN5_9MAGN